jgi:hypothetical protein
MSFQRIPSSSDCRMPVVPAVHAQHGPEDIPIDDDVGDRRDHSVELGHREELKVRIGIARASALGPRGVGDRIHGRPPV